MGRCRKAGAALVVFGLLLAGPLPAAPVGFLHVGVDDQVSLRGREPLPLRAVEEERRGVGRQHPEQGGGQPRVDAVLVCLLHA